MKRIILLLSAILIMALTACQVTVTTTNPVVVTLDTEQVSMTAGSSRVFTATVTGADAADVAWTTSGGVLTPEAGATTTYTAPTTAGAFTVTATVSGQSATANVSVTNPFANAEDKTLGSASDAAASNVAIAAGASAFFRIPVTTEALNANPNKPLLYFELSKVLRVTVFDAAFAAIGSSVSATEFATGESATASTSLESQAIAVNVNCRGACVITPASAATYYVRIDNTSAVDTDFSLFAFLDAYQDTNEAVNNTKAGAVDFASGVAEGAIETLGDEDFFAVQADGSVTFTSDSTIGTLAQIISSTGTVTDLPADQATRVVIGDAIRIYVPNGAKAAVSGASKYSLSY